MFVVLPAVQTQKVNRKNANRTNTRHIPVKSLRAATIICRDFIERNELSNQGWSGGQVYEGAKMVAEICHNGSVWGRDGQELEV